MSDARIFEGKTTNEAIEKGLKELKVTRNEVDIKVLGEEEKRSFFNILAPRVVKVEMSIKERPVEKREPRGRSKERETIVVDAKALEVGCNKVREFLGKFFEQTAGKKLDFECIVSENVIKVNVKDEAADFLIGYRGETLNAMQTLLTAIAIKEAGERVKVEIDALGYREKRKQSLEELAEKISKTVLRTHRPITLEPMSPYERKIIHMTLQNNPRVKTASIGMGNTRKVIVSPR